MKSFSNIPNTATSDLVTEQNEGWKSLVCDGYDIALRVYLCAIEKELIKRINCSTLTPIRQLVNFKSAISRWNKIATKDDKKVVKEIAKKIRTYLSKEKAPRDLPTIVAYVSSEFGHQIYRDDAEIALAKLISDGKVKRNMNCYLIT